MGGKKERKIDFYRKVGKLEWKTRLYLEALQLDETLKQNGIIYFNQQITNQILQFNKCNKNTTNTYVLV